MNVGDKILFKSYTGFLREATILCINEDVLYIKFYDGTTREIVR